MAAKRNVAIVTDSTSYIPHDLVEQYGITVVPQILNWEGQSYLDDVDISNKDFYARLSTAKPILHIDDGRIEPLESVRTKRKALRRLMGLVKELTRGWSEIHAAVVDANAPETADVVFDQLVQALIPTEILRSGLSPVVGTHAGPGAIGVAVLDAGALHDYGQ